MIAQLDNEYIAQKPTKVVSRLMSYFLFEGRPLTTKGRWINPLVFANYKIASLLPYQESVDRPIFIIGTGRSGTTILGKLFSMHKNVGYLNEPKAFWNFLYPHEDIIGGYTDEPAFYRLNASHATEEMKQKANRVYRFYLQSIFSSRVVDKYPELIFRIPFVKALFPNAKFVLIVRNGWDTCYSIKQWSERLGVQMHGETHDWWGKNNRKWNYLLNEVAANDEQMKPIIEEVRKIEDHTDMAAVEWILAMREGLTLKNDASVKMVKYEDLVANCEGTLKQLLDFCELNHDSNMLDYAKKVIDPVPPKAKYEINQCLMPQFNEMMKAYGY